MTSKCTQENFDHDRRDHALLVLHDDGLYRHLRLTRPDSGVFYFDIITWPGSLCVTGDMGTYTFNRIADMLEFFRGDGINAGYWGEKLTAMGRDGFTEYSQESFIEQATEAFNEHWEAVYDGGLSGRTVAENRAACWVEFQADVLDQSELEHDARRALEDFNEYGFSLSDTWEWSYQVCTYRYLWNLYGIVWAIQQYDEHKAKVKNEND